ncbi:MAG: hypothetical protein F6K35_38215, partial [Okeania sp. SIO2H7]|nr:hypothetical protein [Okeania sp. SIO2H7]
EGLYVLLPETVSRVGARRVIVADGAMQSPQLYTPGLGQKISQAASYLEEDLQKTKEHIESVRRGSQQLAGEIQGKAQQMKEQAQEKAGEIKEKAQTLATEAQQKAGEIKEKVKEQHQEFKQRSQSELGEKNGEETSDRFQNQITEVTIKAKEMIGGIGSRQDTASDEIDNPGENKSEEQKTEEITLDNQPQKL